MSEDQTPEWHPKREELEGRVRNFIEFYRWLEIGPASYPLTKGEQRYLLFLGAYEGEDAIITRARMGRIFSDAAPSVSGRIKRMEDQGVIVTHPDPNRKNGLIVELTDKGRRMYWGLCCFLDGNMTETPIGKPLY